MELFEKLLRIYKTPDYYYINGFKNTDIRTIKHFGEFATELISSGKTCLYYDRLYTIYQALKNLPKPPFDTAEVGVFKGGTSKFILHFSPPGTTHYAFDTFEGHCNIDLKGLDRDHKQGDFNKTAFTEVVDYLSIYENLIIAEGRFQERANIIYNEKFGFVHLDVDIYEPTKYALEFFKSRLIPGGVIIIDDYGFISCPGVKFAVDDFLVSNPGMFTAYHQITGQMILTKRY